MFVEPQCAILVCCAVVVALMNTNQVPELVAQLQLWVGWWWVPALAKSLKLEARTCTSQPVRSDLQTFWRCVRVCVALLLRGAALVPVLRL